MPGIYIRKTSEFDWPEQKKNVILTIPGSYWLCHKKNVYKFICKYNRETRHIKEFIFSKELMKVIRRVINSKPDQGQQFSTNHLVVTYYDIDQTAWTRQDKMFALMKFKGPVSAYSYAFVLTIKISSPSESTRYNTEHSKQCSSFGKELDTDEQSVKQVASNKNVNSLTENSKSTSEFIEKNKSESVNEIETNVIVNQSKGSYCLKVENNNEQALKVGCERGKNNSVSPAKDILDNSSSIKNDNIDAANLPYQYLIEQEIEDAECSMSRIKTSFSFPLNINTQNEKFDRDEPNVRKRNSEEANKTNSINSKEVLVNGLETEDLPIKKARISLNSAASRSSDITNLVMEGLMFTIRQEQDSVAVIEQKTKLEIDEVLENSEKVETKEGERGLRNSSLLRLENLITMIDAPKCTKSENNDRYTINQENNRKRRSPNKLLCNDMKHDLKNNKTKRQTVTDKLESVRLHFSDKNTSLASTSFSKDIVEEEEEEEEEEDEEEEEEEEEEDIIPEALQNSCFQSSIFSSARNGIFKERLIEETIKFTSSEMSLRNECTFKSHPCNTNITPQSALNSSNKFRRNGLRIISNEVITIDQIPLSLQKAFNLRKEDSLSSIKGEQSTTCDMQLKSEKLNSSTLKDSQSKRDSDNLINKETLDESVISKSNVTDLKKNLNVSEDNVQQESTGTKKVQLAPNEFQDITENFYQHLSDLQKKTNASNQRYLRSQRKLLSTQRSGSNGETQIEIIKFINDITRGAKVVLNRLSTKSIRKIIGKSSSLTKYTH